MERAKIFNKIQNIQEIAVDYRSRKSPCLHQGPQSIYRIKLSMPRKILLEKVKFKKKKKYGEEFTVMNKSFKERNFRFRNFSFINCVCILVFSCFVLQLLVCESRNSYPNFSIFQIGLFRYQRLILD